MRAAIATKKFKTTNKFNNFFQPYSENRQLKIKLYGELRALLKLGTEPENKHSQAESEGVQIMMVAWVGFEPSTSRL